MFYIYKYEQDVRMFMYPQTKYELNCLVNHRDDKMEVLHNHLRLIHHDVFPNLNFVENRNEKQTIPNIPACRLRSDF